MYNRFLIIASKKDKAGVNITTALSQFRKNPIWNSTQDAKGFDFYLRDEEIISDKNLDIKKINNYDFIIFASKHQSEAGGKTLSIHAPGNWREVSNDFGGKSGKICLTSALFLKQTFEILNKNVKESDLDYQVTLECTHHGPLIEKPCMFIEIGSREEQWNDRRAAFVIAKTINEIIENFEENTYREIAVGIGGPHYCPNFNKIQLNSNVAISHIIPQYVFPISEEMVKEAIIKTDEEIDFFVLDWKGLGNSEERQRVISILERNYINYKKTSEIKK